MKKLISWCSNNFYTISSLFLLAFIPLYPKLPLINVIRTWVYIRLEDFIIVFLVGVFVLLTVIKRKLPKTYLTWPILTYWGIGLISTAISIAFIGKHIQDFHWHLALFHYARRIEYMMLFFFAFSMIVKRPKTVHAVIWVLGVTVLGVIVYGAGQKFFGFPAFLTMNEEFAKGIPLRLPPTARIPSTFAGHYDLAAYMVLVLPILGSLVIGLKRWWEKLVFFVLTAGSLVTLLFTASRVSFGVYLIAISMMLFWQKKKILIIPVIIVSIIFLNFVSGASERFYKTFRFSNVIVDMSSGKPIGTLDKLEGTTATMGKSQSPGVESLPTGSEFINVPTSQTNQPAQQVKTVELVRNKLLATGSGEIATISGSFLIQKALVYDISITTRFQGEWPNAMKAFLRNVVTGSGFSSISLATDGDYVRMLGETGVLGSIAFLGIFLAAFILFLRKHESLAPIEKAFVIGVFAGVIGLMLNGVLIDVFEASKVAYTLWLLLGFAIALLSREELPLTSYIKMVWNFLTHPVSYIVYIMLFALLFHLKSLQWYFIGDDFTWLRWAAQSTFKDLPRYFTEAQGFFYRPIPKLWYFGLYSIFWLKSGAYHFFSLMLLGGSASFLYLLMSGFGVNVLLSLLGTALFCVLSIHHENVYWISGQSSLLSALFLLMGLYIFQRCWLGWAKLKKLDMAIGIICLLISMLSYDGMLVVPFIVWIVGVFGYKQSKKRMSWLLLLIPFYWFIRIYSKAVLPSGDYGYNPLMLPVNVIANTFGYVMAIFFGPRVVEGMTFIREGIKQYRVGIGIISLIAAGGALWFIKRFYIRFTSMGMSLVLVLCGLASLSAYLGLGGIAERYGFVASAFFILSLVVEIERLWKHKKNATIVVCLTAVLVGLIIWNVSESRRLQDDWDTASHISQNSVLMIQNQFFPLDGQKAFIFINTPIRFGRAWVFPTGMSDPLWHMFRLNIYPYTVRTAASVDQGFTYPVGSFAREILVFDKNYNISIVEKEIQVIPVEEKK